MSDQVSGHVFAFAGLEWHVDGDGNVVAMPSLRPENAPSLAPGADERPGQNVKISGRPYTACKILPAGMQAQIVILPILRLWQGGKVRTILMAAGGRPARALPGTGQ